MVVIENRFLDLTQISYIWFSTPENRKYINIIIDNKEIHFNISTRYRYADKDIMVAFAKYIKQWKYPPQKPHLIIDSFKNMDEFINHICKK